MLLRRQGSLQMQDVSSLLLLLIRGVVAVLLRLPFLRFFIATLRRFAEDDLAVNRPVADSGDAVGRSRLLVRGNTLDPDPTHSSRRPISRGNRRRLLALWEPGKLRQPLRELRVRGTPRREKPRRGARRPTSIGFRHPL